VETGGRTHSWTCVDSSLNNLPIVAWTDFQTEARDNLHEPTPCQLSYYHYQAGMLAPRVLDIICELLDERLAARPDANCSSVHIIATGGDKNNRRFARKQRRLREPAFLTTLLLRRPNGAPCLVL